MQLDDMEMDEASGAAALEIVAQGVIGKRVEEMEGGFMMALDYMIQLAEKDNDDQVLPTYFQCRHCIYIILTIDSLLQRFFMLMLHFLYSAFVSKELCNF